VSSGQSRWWWAATRAVGDMLYTCPARLAARGFARAADMRSAGGDDDGSWVGLYHFRQVPRVEAATYGLAGACHGCEMAFVWRNDHELSGAYELSLSSMMSSAWVNLAASGNPNGLDGLGFGGRQRWPRFRRSHEEAALVFGGQVAGGVTVEPRLRHRFCDFWDSVAGHCAEVYTQCGGLGWPGPTCCIAGCSCVVQSSFYSQCLPPANTTICEQRNRL
jgi:carboxylesterase type B